MKRNILIVFAISVIGAISLTACSSLSSMSDEDAYNVGYGIGTLYRNLTD